MATSFGLSGTLQEKLTDKLKPGIGNDWPTSE